MERVSLLPLSRKTKKIQEAVIELESINSTFKEQKESYEKRKSELQDIIKDYTDKNKLEEFGIKHNSSLFKVRPIINKKITWDVAKLSKKLKKEVFNEVIKREYSINDMDGLVKYLKTCGVDPKKFKRYINVTETVDNKKIDELGQLGEIDPEQLTGCYELQANFSYVKISMLEDESEEGTSK